MIGEGWGVLDVIMGPLTSPAISWLLDKQVIVIFPHCWIQCSVALLLLAKDVPVNPVYTLCPKEPNLDPICTSAVDVVPSTHHSPVPSSQILNESSVSEGWWKACPCCRRDSFFSIMLHHRNRVYLPSIITWLVHVPHWLRGWSWDLLWPRGAKEHTSVPTPEQKF